MELSSGDRVELDEAGVSGRVAICGRRLVWADGDPGERDLALLDLDGGGVTPLVESPGDDAEPAFSPDCSQLAFASDRAGHWDVWVTDLDSGELRAITDDEEEDRWPTWAPDGERLALLRRFPAQDELVVYAPGEPLATLVAGEGLLGAPAWHPSEERVAYHRCADVDEGCGVWIHHLERRVDTAIASEGCNDQRPVWVLADSLEGGVVVHRSMLLLQRRVNEQRVEAVLASDMGYLMWGLGEGAPGGCCVLAD